MAPKKVPLKPKLEALREEGLKDPGAEYNVNKMLERTSRIHAGWLFDFKFQSLLQKLCRRLDGNYDTHNTPGWGAFGDKLGLTSEVLNVIQCSKLGNEGYTYYALQHYVQKEDSTIHKVISALLNIQRFDVLNETHSYFNKLADHVLASNSNNSGNVPAIQNEEESGYVSIQSEGRDSQGNRSDEDENTLQRNIEGHIIRPTTIPTPAFILQDLEKQVKIQSIELIPRMPEVVHERTQSSGDNTSYRVVNELTENIQTLKIKKVQKYDCKVLLTFAADGINFANNIANTLRKKREDGLRIGVLILDEQAKVVEANPELFIVGVFPQVDYVIPVITEGYLEAAMTVRSPVQENPYIDCKYVRFIYSLMNKNYVQNGCLNRKVRCVIPDELLHLTRKTLMREPIFETWIKSSSIHKLADRMLRRCARKSTHPPSNDALTSVSINE